MLLNSQSRSSHLFQRVASFLHREMLEKFKQGLAEVLISFREWLHSYVVKLIKGVFERLGVLISFREWLHSYTFDRLGLVWDQVVGSHLFQRVASFLHQRRLGGVRHKVPGSSHLFQRVASFLLMRLIQGCFDRLVLISFREWLHSYQCVFHPDASCYRLPVLISFREWLHSYQQKT